MNQIHTFHVKGMHCPSCVILIEETLSEFPHVTHADANLKKLSVVVEGDFEENDPALIAKTLSKPLIGHGYELLPDKPTHERGKFGEYKIAFPIAFAFIGLFIALQKLGIVNLVNAQDVSYGTAFVIGIIASVSTCMAVVGGLVLSVSANYAKEGNVLKPQLMFHIGRLVAFFILGGVIGAIGSAFQLGAGGTFVLSMLVGLVLLVLGLNLLDIAWARKFQITMPTQVSKRILGVKKVNHIATPLLLGIATFFLPCGFTQSMQIFTLSTGSFVEGAMTMLSYALGTLPVLALLSFSYFAITGTAQSKIFFKTAGIVVVFFALINIVNALTVAGIIPPVLNL